MARPGVTYQEVTKAVTQLVESGEYPSIEAIRHVAVMARLAGTLKCGVSSKVTE